MPMYTTMFGIGVRVVLVLTIMAVMVTLGMARWGLIAVWICIFLDLNFRAVAMEVVFRRGEVEGEEGVRQGNCISNK